MSLVNNVLLNSEVCSNLIDNLNVIILIIFTEQKLDLCNMEP